jgi:hydroxymethylglutaryl-CoA lyase
MEDLCFMLDSMGLKTGVNLDLLLKTRQTMSESLSDLKLHGALARAGLPHGFVSNWSAVAA